MSSFNISNLPPNVQPLVSTLKKYWYITLTVAIILIAVVLIFILASPYAIWKVPNEFDESPYLGAKIYEGQKPVVVYREKVLALAMQNADTQDPDEFEGFWRLLGDREDSVIVWENFTLKDAADLLSKIDKNMRKLEDEAQALRGGDFYANYDRLQTLRQRFQSLQRFKSYVQKPKLDISDEYALVAFKRHEAGRYRLSVNENTIRPLIDLKLIEDMNIEPAVLQRFETTAEKQKQELEQKREEAETRYEKDVLDPQRAAVAKAFWVLWYRMLCMYVGSCVATLILGLFFSKIQRTGIKSKSTENLYFATNKSQKIFQWIAIIIVFLTILFIWGKFLLAMLATFFGSAFLIDFMPSIFEDSILDYPFVFLLPIILAVMAIVQAWFFLLASEFIWFLSNCYHLTHIKTYGEEGTRPKD